MKLSVSTAPQLLLGIFCLLGGVQVNATTTAKCNADNCYRALFPTNSPADLSTASAFCATYTSGIHTATTGFPSRAAKSCSSSPSRFSSACLCRVSLSPTSSTSIPTTTTPKTTTPKTTTPTTTIPTTTILPTTISSTSIPIPNNSTITVPTTIVPTTIVPTTIVPTTPVCADTGLVKNGGFECGIAPWQPAATPGTVYAITSPGKSGNFAFEVDQVGVADTTTGREQASVNQDVSLQVGVPYVLSFSSYFNRGDAGFIGVMIDHSPVYTVDAEDFNGPLVWNQNTISFFATRSPTNIRIEFLFGATGSVDKIDDVSVTPQSA